MIFLPLQKELLAVTEKKDSLNAQFVHVNKENRALLDSKHQLTSRLVSIMYCIVNKVDSIIILICEFVERDSE